MAGRPSTARSEISSAISEDGYTSRPQSGVPLPSIHNPPVSQHGYAHLRGITQPTNRSIRSNPSPGGVQVAPSSTAGSSRPQSPVSQASRTHVPSLTAQGFFRPLSSQRLQAQRLRRPTGTRPVQPPAPIPDSEADADTRSVASSRQGPFHAMPRSHRTAPSIATDYTQSEAPETADPHSPEDASHHDGDTHLVHDRNTQPHKPSRLNIAATHKAGDAPQKSPMSFRSGLSLSSKHRLEAGHQPLSSNVNSPQYPKNSNVDIAKQSALGKNYEYFEGNTIFWLGGRLQNARDRPVNVATGIVLVLPAILFFVYS
jgi:palmitoyltransferase ZDHHC9/14/18